MMNTKTRLILIVALFGISAVVLAVAFLQREGTPAPVTTPPPATEPSGMADTSATPDATTPPDETETPATPEATTATTPPDNTTVEPDTLTPASEPTPVLAPEVELARELIEQGKQVTYSVGECVRILENEPWCSVIKSAERITRPEWEELFPRTDFYLVKTELHGSEFPQQRNWLIVEQDGHRYTAKTFDRLLKANGVITITDENRELVTRAFVLMTLPDYLEEEIVFSSWGEVTDGPEVFFDLRANYGITAWTKIQGLEFRWLFLFLEGRLRVAGGGIIESGVGDYIDIPHDTLRPPPSSSLTYHFWGE